MYRMFAGNASLPMMMRYFHISPDHLQGTIQFGPTLQQAKFQLPGGESEENGKYQKSCRD